MAKLIPNRFQGNKCKSCRTPQPTGVTIAWLGKGEGIQCRQCYETYRPIPQSEEQVMPETEAQQAVEPVIIRHPDGTPKAFDEMNVEELRKSARNQGFQGGTVLLTLSKAQLLEWLKTGQYSPKAFEPVVEQPKHNGNGTGNAIADAINAAINTALGSVKVEAPQVMTEAEIKAYLDKQIAEYVNKPYEIHLPEGKVVKLEKRTHQVFPLVLKLAGIHKTVLLVGPAGTGKSTLGQHIAEALGLEHGFINCSGGTSESHFLGRPTPDGGYIPTLFVKLFEQGGVFVIDEIDGADANVLMVLNAALANGHLALPARKDNPIALRHKDFVLIACANTYGTANSIEYAGRNQLDAATLDRFGGGASRVFVDFDSKLESAFAGEFVAELAELVIMRRKAAEGKVRRVIGTRAVIAMAKERASGISFEDFKSRLLLGWSETERAKVA